MTRSDAVEEALGNYLHVVSGPFPLASGFDGRSACGIQRFWKSFPPDPQDRATMWTESNHSDYWGMQGLPGCPKCEEASKG